jgi:hypothetical protein
MIDFDNWTDDHQAWLRENCDVIEPPPGFGLGTELTSGLTVYYKEAQGQKFWLYDHEGFLASTASLQVVEVLLQAEARRVKDEKRPFYQVGARDVLFPGHAKEKEEHMQTMQQNARQLAARARERSGMIQGTPGSGTELNLSSGERILKTLGLDD